MLRTAVFAAVLACALALPMAEPYRATANAKPGEDVKCRMTPQQFPPAANRVIPTEVVDLDLPPQERWTAIVTPRANDIKALINEVFDKLPANFTSWLLAEMDKDSDAILNKFPPGFGDEMLGIANAIGMDVGLVVVYNIFYEISSLCTSIVAQDTQGNVYHARNLDFGLFLGWNTSAHDWAVTGLLRPLLFNAQFVSNGQIVFNTTQYAGYVGVLTGFKTGGFSITVDTRFNSEFDIQLIEWFTGLYKASFVGFLNREVLTTNTSYSQALSVLSTEKLISPVYLILGGSNAGDGAVITRNPADTANLWTLQSQLNNGSWFLLQTNYDHWKPAPFFDDRSGPGILCMDQLGQAGVSFSGLFEVLSGKPNLNALTTYTALIHVATGEFVSYLQYCEEPGCPLW